MWRIGKQNWYQNWYTYFDEIWQIIADISSQICGQDLINWCSILATQTFGLFTQLQWKGYKSSRAQNKS